jgi:aspartyl aminopeptidase
MFLYPRQGCTVTGYDEEYILAPRLDDLQCAFSAAKAFIESDNDKKLTVCAVFDNEEVGSRTKQGADSTFLTDTIHRIMESLSVSESEWLSHMPDSFMLSADNAHAVHPNHPEFADPNNAPVVNKGVVLKFNANQRYTTDGVSAAIFRKLCGKANVPVQTYCNRADLAGGSTLGNISLTHVSVQSADIGLPQLAMHSCYETAGVQDAIWMEEVLTTFYGTSLEVTNGNYILK